MIHTGVIIEITKQKQIVCRIPPVWRNKINVEQGNIATLFILNDSVKIKISDQYTNEIISTIGKDGQIYIPAEVRNHFISKGIKYLKVTIDEASRHIILKPLE